METTREEVLKLIELSDRIDRGCELCAESFKKTLEECKKMGDEDKVKEYTEKLDDLEGNKEGLINTYGCSNNLRNLKTNNFFTI